MQIAIGIVLIIAALFLIVAVLMQSSKNHNLSGTIAGGAETFFGKTKGSTLDKKLSKLTTVVAIIFCILVLVSYLLQDTTNYSGMFDNSNIITQETESATDAIAEEATDAVTEEATDAVAEEVAEEATDAVAEEATDAVAEEATDADVVTE